MRGPQRRKSRMISPTDMDGYGGRQLARSSGADIADQSVDIFDVLDLDDFGVNGVAMAAFGEKVGPEGPLDSG